MFEVNKRARGGKRALHGETKVVGSTQLHLYSFVAVAVTVTVEHVFTCEASYCMYVCGTCMYVCVYTGVVESLPGPIIQALGE